VSTEAVGIVCRSCKHFTPAFTMSPPPETVAEFQREAQNHDIPETCAECGESLEGQRLEPESERRKVAADTARVRRNAVESAWGGRGR